MTAPDDNYESIVAQQAEEQSIVRARLMKALDSAKECDSDGTLINYIVGFLGAGDAEIDAKFKALRDGYRGKA